MHQRAFARITPMRARVFFYACAAVAAFLTWRLIDVQIVNGARYARYALEQRSDTVEVYARRGSILDRNGAVLVRSLPSQSVYAVPHDISDPDRVVKQLETIFGKLDPSTIADLHDRRLWFVWIARKIPHDQAERVRALHLLGIQLKEEQTGLRVDTVGTLASTVLGFVGTDENGLDGLEYADDALLRGRSGKVSLETDEFGRPIPLGHEKVITPALPGASIELTIDSYLQFVAERALATQMRAFHAADGSAVVMNPWTGAILALANLPDFDPNHFWRYPPNALRDRAVMDAYEPGSTYKLITAAAALTSGKVTLQSRFPARDEIVVGGHTIHNAEDGFMAGTGGSETMEQIIEYSHNVGAAEIGMRIGARAFWRMEQRAGLGQPTGVGLPGENPGIVPPPSQWSASSLATMSFGQGVSITPLALVRYYCAIANGGLLMQPRIVHAIAAPGTDTFKVERPKVVRRIFSPKIAAELRRFLRAVVVRGTGDPTAQVPGYQTAGKTGTAQIAVDGRYQPGAYTASFIGMIPYQHPRFVILVKVTRPIGSYYGSAVAAPAFAAIARAAMLHAGVLPNMKTGDRG